MSQPPAAFPSAETFLIYYFRILIGKLLCNFLLAMICLLLLVFNFKIRFPLSAKLRKELTRRIFFVK